MRDLTDFDAINGVQRNLRFISPDGKRSDVVNGYLHPKLQDPAFPNLHVVVNTKIVRVLIEDGKAVGIETEAVTKANETTSEGCNRSIRARKMVVVSCGALGTPLVLERSGLGSSGVLSKHGISTVADLPGVGEQYQDHQLMLYSYRSSLNPEESLDALAGGRLDPAELIKNNDPVLGWNGQDVTSKIRPTNAQAATFEGELKKTWERRYKPYTDRPLVQLTFIPV